MPYLTPQQVAEELGWSVRRVWRRINDGSLPATNLGTDSQPRWFIDAEEFKQWVAKGRNQPVAPDDPEEPEQ